MMDRAQYFRDWHQRNKEHRARLRRNRYLANKSKYLIQALKWHQSHPESVKASGKKYRSKPEYKEFHKKRMAEYRAGNKEKLSRWRKQWIAKEPEKFRKRTREWLASHPEVARQNSLKRRALKRSVTIDSSRILEWMRLIKSRDFRVCYYCRRLIHSCQIHFDHIIPLARSGPHRIENLCVSCPRCNLSKGSKLISEWNDKPELILDL